MPSRYQRLADYLAAHSGDVVQLTFADVEAIIGASLPATAYSSGWWQNRARFPARAWRAGGWWCTAVAIGARWTGRAANVERWVELRRIESSDTDG